MSNRASDFFLVVTATAAMLAVPSSVSYSRAVRVETPVLVRANDNRVPAGVLRGTTLTLRLVATTGMWHPNGDAQPGARMKAFAEEGRAPSIPGPLIRVRAGTELSVTVRNAIVGAPLTVRGLTSRDTAPARNDSLRLEPGETRTIRVRLDAPGTYYYWGTTTGRPMVERFKDDAQLTGAIVVDPADGPPPHDRIFVLGMWADTSGRSEIVRERLLSVINGLSWPHTERFTQHVGDTVHWRVINASADMHPMHLHGFYFRVDSRGTALGDSVYAPGARNMAVTDLVKPGGTMTMTWSPTRPGNWLFHCHLPEHISARGPLGMLPVATTPHAHGNTNHAMEGMNGLVIGIVVQPKAGSAPAPAERRGRAMRLVIGAKPGGTVVSPLFEYVLTDSGGDRVPSVAPRAAPPIVLTRGQPVTITVQNALAEATAVHWHGIELESYYDGVAGFSGFAKRVAPVIAPGDSFVARFTPPRSGTFIYHTHIDEGRQQPAGLAGPIIVLEPGEKYDPAHDLTFVLSSRPDSALVSPRNVRINGSTTLAPLHLQTGAHYRIRFINMTTHGPGLRFELLQDGRLAAWRALAKDGADLPKVRQTMRVARQQVSIGETADVELTPESPGDLHLSVSQSDGLVVGGLDVRVSGDREAPR
ncbi:MAG: multicopper oxidase domain-containing protein [Gemmatimonadaceae bacterium]